MTIYFDEIDSTNDYLKRNFNTLEDYTLVIAKHQTKGKGRLNRTWLDSGNDLSASLLVKNLEGDVSKLSLISSYAIFKVLKSLGLAISIKWPNDIYYGDKKLCGILIETIYSTTVTAIIGFGINTNSTEFDPCLNATSILLEKGIRINNKDLAEKIKDELEYAIKNVGFEEVVKLNKENAYLLGKEVFLNYYGEGIRGKVIDLLENGNILLETSDGNVEIHTGEISLKK